MSGSLRDVSTRLGVTEDAATLFGAQPSGLGISAATVRHTIGLNRTSLRDLDDVIDSLPAFTLGASCRLEDRDATIVVRINGSAGLVAWTHAYLVPAGQPVVMRGPGVSAPAWSERGTRAGRAGEFSLWPHPGRYDLIVVRSGIETSGPRTAFWRRPDLRVRVSSGGPGGSGEPQKPPAPIPPVITATPEARSDGGSTISIEGTGFAADRGVAVRVVSLNDPSLRALERDGADGSPIRSDRTGRLRTAVVVPSQWWIGNAAGTYGVGVSAADGRTDPRSNEPLWSNVVRILGRG